MGEREHGKAVNITECMLDARHDTRYYICELILTLTVSLCDGWYYIPFTDKTVKAQILIMGLVQS